MYDQKLINAIGKTLIRKKLTIAAAESVTAGHLQAALSLAENARQFFQGGVVAYNIGQKVKLLKVDPIHAEGCNCVSAVVAGQMAAGVSRLFTSTFGVAITGYAAPVPEYGIEDLFAFYAVTRYNKVIKHGRIRSSADNAMLAQQEYVDKVLRVLRSILPKQ